MASSQPPITGHQHKRFDDEVAIGVYYTRHGSNITHINWVEFEYKYKTTRIDYDCIYDEILRIAPVVDVGNGDMWINAGSRVRWMMGEVESELRLAEEQDAQTDSPRSPDRSPPLTATASVIDIGLADAINLDGSINLQAIGNDENQTSTETSIKGSTPKRQRTRWELLELD